MRFVRVVAVALAVMAAPAWAETPAPGGNYGDALRWYVRAAEAGDARAQFLLAIRFEKGIGVDTDLVQAAAWYRQAAEGGHAEAQFKLGTLLEQGRGVAVDLEAAFGWYRLAAESGLAEAQYNYGVAYLNGSGTERDVVEALAWIDLAAEQGLDVAVALRDRLLDVLPEEMLSEAQSRADTLRTRLTAN